VSFEFMLNALRLPDGFKESTFSERTGMPFSDVSATVEAARAKGLLEKSPQGRWRPTALGLRFLNDLQAGFLVQD
jgi:oxygen-independent coproporphyrinogen-3 oxidase